MRIRETPSAIHRSRQHKTLTAPQTHPHNIRDQNRPVTLTAPIQAVVQPLCPISTRFRTVHRRTLRTNYETTMTKADIRRGILAEQQNSLPSRLLPARTSPREMDLDTRGVTAHDSRLTLTSRDPRPVYQGHRCARRLASTPNLPSTRL